MDDSAIQRDNEAGRVVVQGEPTDPGELCSLVVAGDPGQCPVSEPASADQAPAPGGVRAPRCGRSVPALHLLEADETLTQPSWRVGSRVHAALCGVEVTESTPAPDYEVCPGCADCTRYCVDCVQVARRYAGENGQTRPAEPGHPVWCSPRHCYRQDEDGLLVHVQRPVVWEDDCAEARFESGLVHPLDDDRTYLELSVESLLLGNSVHVVLAVAGARRLRDQLSAHLDAADGERHDGGRQNCFIGECGHRVPGEPGDRGMVIRVGPCRECGDEPT